MVSSWSAGTSSRIAASTSSARRAVSSMRVPVGARMCRRIWPASTLGKKSRPRTRIEAARQQAERQEADATKLRRAARAAPTARACSRARTRSNWRVEAAVDALQQARLRAGGGVAVVLAAHQQHHQRRHQRPRQEVGRDHREHHRLGQRHEQEARHAREEEHRHEHDADAQRRDEGRHADLAGADEDRLVQLGAQVQVALDVLDRHDRLVDQDADRQREAAQRHQVERLAERSAG